MKVDSHLILLLCFKIDIKIQDSILSLKQLVIHNSPPSFQNHTDSKLVMSCSTYKDYLFITSIQTSRLKLFLDLIFFFIKVFYTASKDQMEMKKNLKSLQPEAILVSSFFPLVQYKLTYFEGFGTSKCDCNVLTKKLYETK